MTYDKILLCVSICLLVTAIRNCILARYYRMQCEEAMKTIKTVEGMLDETIAKLKNKGNEDGRGQED